MVELTIGSKCRVYTYADDGKVKENVGIFSGIINIGEDSALVLEMEEVEGKYRIIPVSAVTAIDIIELKKVEEKREDKTTYFT